MGTQFLNNLMCNYLRGLQTMLTYENPVFPEMHIQFKLIRVQRVERG